MIMNLGHWASASIHNHGLILPVVILMAVAQLELAAELGGT